MLAEGSNGSVELTTDGIILRHKGFANVLTQGIQGDKHVPFSSITSVQFKAAGRWMAGMIQFTIKGDRAVGGGLMEATKDENAVLFTRDQQKAFETLEAKVRASIGKPNSSNATSELTQLAALLDKGFLTRDEFDARKRQILG